MCTELILPQSLDVLPFRVVLRLLLRYTWHHNNHKWRATLRCVFFGGFEVLLDHKTLNHKCYLEHPYGYTDDAIFLDRVWRLRVLCTLSWFDTSFHNKYKSNKCRCLNPDLRLGLNAINVFLSKKKAKTYDTLSHF